MADEVLVDYKANIDGFIAQTRTAAAAVRGVGTAGQQAADKTTTGFKSSTQQVSQLSRGVAGLTSLIGLAGRAFGINTDALLLFTEGTRELVRASRSLNDISKLSKLAIDANAVSTVAGAAATTAAAEAITTAAEATKSATIVQRIFNFVVKENPIILLISALVAAAGALLLFSGNTEKSVEELKKQREEIEKNEKANRDFIKSLTDLDIERKRLSGEITDREAVTLKLENDRDSKVIENKLAFNKKKKEIDDAFDAGNKTTATDIAAGLLVGSVYQNRRIEKVKADHNEALLLAEREFNDANTRIVAEFILKRANAGKEAGNKAEEEEKKAKAKTKDDINKAAEAEIKRQQELLKAENKLIREQILEQIRIVEDGKKGLFTEEDNAFRDRLKKAGLFNVDRITLEGDSLKALELLEIEHGENINAIIKKIEDERTKIEADAAKERARIEQEEFDADTKSFEDANKKLVDEFGKSEAIKILKQRGDFVAAKKLEEELKKERIKQAIDIGNELGKAAAAQAEREIEAINKKQTEQEKNIEVQKDLASKGLQNDLAAEAQRGIELERARIKEEKRLRRIKEFEIFLNSLAKYSQTENFFTALAKATRDIAITKKVASAIFAEEGGVLGETATTYSGGRKHRGGGDVFLHAQLGEGIFSRSQVNKMGGVKGFTAFQDALDSNMFQMPMAVIANVQNKYDNQLLEAMQGVEKKLDKLKVVHHGFDSFGDYTKTITQNFYKKSLTYKSSRWTNGR